MALTSGLLSTPSVSKREELLKKRQQMGLLADRAVQTKGSPPAMQGGVSPRRQGTVETKGGFSLTDAVGLGVGGKKLYEAGMSKLGDLRGITDTGGNAVIAQPPTQILPASEGMAPVFDASVPAVQSVPAVPAATGAAEGAAVLEGATAAKTAADATLASKTAADITLASKTAADAALVGKTAALTTTTTTASTGGFGAAMMGALASNPVGWAIGGALLVGAIVDDWF